MKTKWLFPHSFRLIGWFIVAVLTIFLFVSNLFSESLIFAESHNHATALISSEVGRFDADEVEALGFIIGLLFIAFSKEKVEDEMISQLRLEALQWSVYANYLILMVSIVTVYDMAFFNVMIYNMFTILLVFITRFRWLIFRTTILRYEKPTES